MSHTGNSAPLASSVATLTGCQGSTNAFGTIVIGKRETLRRPGVIGPGEVPLDWPDQGSPERNWVVNVTLVRWMLRAGCPIRDADVSWGVLGNDSGFLARERAQIRSAGLRMGADGYWKAQRRSLVDLAPRLLARAHAAAEAGAQTFAFPEAAPVAAWIAARVADPALRSEAVGWLMGGAGYHDLIRLCARAVSALDPAAPPSFFRLKAGGDLEAILALWRDVLLVPTTARQSRSELVRLRMFPVHPLGLIAEPTWADGDLLTPSEYFFHDLDHARFKIREDFMRRGLDIPDAYEDGSTIDPRTGRHRAILPEVASRLAVRLHGSASSRPAAAQRLIAGVRSLRKAEARAAELLLFELVHEKSLPLDSAALARAVADDAPVAKLWRKQGSGFFGSNRPMPEVMNALPAAAAALARICR